MYANSLLCQCHIIEHFDTGTAGAGSLILEFATLSRLTGDERFEKAAYKVRLHTAFTHSDTD